jgi:alkylhydroperoxidase family enzyme
MFQNREEAAAAVYQSFLNSGFSPAQARALTAEINRENSLQERYLFGTHIDPANKATNLGMLSWQGSRAPKAQAFLKKAGALDEQGRIIPGMKALQAQADFIKQEMETQPEYRRTREEFLANPNVDPETAAVVLGDNYIRWRRTDPEYSASGNKAIAEGYQLLGGAGAEPLSKTTYESRRRQYALGDADPGTAAQVLQAVVAGDMTKSEAGQFVSEELLEGLTGGSAFDILNEEKEEASFFDRLGDAAAYMDFAGIGQAQQLDTPSRLSTTINPGRQNVGSSALQRFGIASLV